MKSPTEVRISVAPGVATTALVYAAGGVVTADRPTPGAGATLILAHGAGAGQRSPFIAGLAAALSARGLDVITFNFLYTEQGRRLPDRAPLLETTYRAVIDAIRAQAQGARRALFIGGKSMGGRIATQVAAADAAGLAGLVLLGYPLHPPGRPDRRRDAHLPAVNRPMLFVQGSRDAFGTPSELSPLLATLHPGVTLHVVEGGDHSLKLSRSDVRTQTAVHDDVQRTIAEWVAAISATAAAGHPHPA